MRLENQIQEKIKELLDSVDNTIPVTWEELYINSSISETGGHVFFFFRIGNEEEIHYSLQIPEDFNVSEEIFDELDDKNYIISNELWKIFKDNDLTPWKNATIIYKNKKLNTWFDYVDWNSSPFGPNDQVNYFRYKYLGFKPRSDKEIQKFKEMDEFQKQFI